MNIQQPAVNFYILPDSDSSNRHFFVYRLVEKAFKEQLKTLILTADIEQAKTLDRLIWTAEPSRFIPHEILQDNQTDSESLPSILISDNLFSLSRVNFHPHLVIDLSHDGTPLNYPRIMLIANQHNEILANARMKYQSYINQGIKPTVHKISEKQLAVS